MVETIMGMLETIFNVFVSIGEGASVTSMEGFSPELFGIVQGFAANIFKPIGYTVLSCFAMLEFVHIFQRFDSVNGMTGVEIPIKIMVKVFLCKLCIDYSPEIIGALNAIGQQIMAGLTTSATSTTFNSEVFRASVEDMGVLGQIGLMIQVCLVYVIAIGCEWICKIVIYGRVFELYVLLAVSPLPLSTFCSEDLKSTGLNFLKYTFSVILQGGLIVLVTFLFAKYIAVGGDFSTIGNITDVAWQFVGLAMVLVFCIFKTASWAKSICNVI